MRITHETEYECPQCGRIRDRAVEMPQETYSIRHYTSTPRDALATMYNDLMSAARAYAARAPFGIAPSEKAISLTVQNFRKMRLAMPEDNRGAIRGEIISAIMSDACIANEEMFTTHQLGIIVGLPTAGHPRGANHLQMHVIRGCYEVPANFDDLRARATCRTSTRPYFDGAIARGVLVEAYAAHLRDAMCAFVADILRHAASHFICMHTQPHTRALGATWYALCATGLFAYSPSGTAIELELISETKKNTFSKFAHAMREYAGLRAICLRYFGRV